MKKRLAILLTALFLFAGIGLSLHHHSDGYVHQDCPVCVVASHHQSMGADSNPVPAPAAAVIFVISIILTLQIAAPSRRLRQVRAPPF